MIGVLLLVTAVAVLPVPLGSVALLAVWIVYALRCR